MLYLSERIGFESNGFRPTHVEERLVLYTDTLQDVFVQLRVKAKRGDAEVFESPFTISSFVKVLRLQWRYILRVQALGAVPRRQWLQEGSSRGNSSDAPAPQFMLRQLPRQVLALEAAEVLPEHAETFLKNLARYARRGAVPRRGRAFWQWSQHFCPHKKYGAKHLRRKLS